ncbi:MAG: O-antigen ligase family protein [Candidatus Omnitrophica bacterium]|nr:O-antigen ligase family protein [Candidatus Omnitrophota bacterium]
MVNSQDKISGALMLGQYLNGFLLFLICQNLTPPRKEEMVQCLVMTGICASLLAIHQYFFGFQDMLDYLKTNQIDDPIAQAFINERRVFAPFITPNMLGGYLVMMIPLAYGLKNFRWFIPLLVIALLMTKSVGAIFSLCLVLLLAYLWNKQIKIYVLLGMLALLSTTIVTLFLRTQTTAWHSPLFSVQMRWDYWMESIGIIKDHPWVGIGLGSFDLNNSRYAHNSYLQLWAQSGPLAVITFLILVGTILRAGLCVVKASAAPLLASGALIALMVFLIHNMIDFTFFLPETGLIAAVIAGLLLNPQRSCPRSAA